LAYLHRWNDNLSDSHIERMFGAVPTNTQVRACRIRHKSSTPPAALPAMGWALVPHCGAQVQVLKTSILLAHPTGVMHPHRSSADLPPEE